MPSTRTIFLSAAGTNVFIPGFVGRLKRIISDIDVQPGVLQVSVGLSQGGSFLPNAQIVQAAGVIYTDQVFNSAYGAGVNLLGALIVVEVDVPILMATALAVQSTNPVNLVFEVP